MKSLCTLERWAFLVIMWIQWVTRFRANAVKSDRKFSSLKLRCCCKHHLLPHPIEFCILPRSVFICCTWSLGKTASVSPKDNPSPFPPRLFFFSLLLLCCLGPTSGHGFLAAVVSRHLSLYEVKMWAPRPHRSLIDWFL